MTNDNGIKFDQVLSLKKFFQGKEKKEKQKGMWKRLVEVPISHNDPSFNLLGFNLLNFKKSNTKALFFNKLRIKFFNY